MEPGDLEQFERRAERKRRRRGRISGFLAAILLLAAGVVADRLDPPRPGGPPVPPLSEGPGAEGDEKAPDQAALSPRWQATTGPQTLLIFKTLYPYCNSETTRTRNAGTSQAGLTQDDLARRTPDWEIVSFRPGEVILTRTVEGPCPDEAWYRTVTIREGRIAVFAGRPENPGPLLQDTGIPVDDLLPADREKLAAGVAVTGGDAGVWEFLEGLGRE